MKVYLDTIGCRLNQSEVEHMAGLLFAAGHEIVSSPSQAEAIIINTCAVTSQAAADSRQLVRKSAALPGVAVYATGCWATLEPGAAAGLGNAVQVVANDAKDSLVPQKLLQGEAAEHLGRGMLPGKKARTRAFIKTQDGCDNACTYCVTRIARGRSVSVPAEDVIKDIEIASRQGVREIVLTGVNLGSWRSETDTGLRLVDLVGRILTNTTIPRIRLSSLEPWDLDEQFFELWRDPRMCRHLHLSLQSGSDRMLRRMGRKNTAAVYKALVERARAVAPQMAVTTDIIAGFPGETEGDFEHTLEFIRDLPFSGGHVFSFSARPGTAASTMAEQVPGKTIKARAAVLRQSFEDLAASYRQQFVGDELAVLWEGAKKIGDYWRMSGLTDNYIRVHAMTDTDLTNQINMVSITGSEPGSLTGKIA